MVPVIFTGSAYDVIDVNECFHDFMFHDFMFVNRAHAPPPRFGKFSSTARILLHLGRLSVPAITTSIISG